MKILFLSELFFPHGGGAEFATYLIAKQLAMAGHQVKVVTNAFQGEPAISLEAGVTVIRKSLLRKSSVKYSILLQVGRFYEKWMTDLIEWSDVVYIPRYWFSAIPFVKRYGKPLIVHLHDYIPICPVANLFDSRSYQLCRNNECSSKCIYSYERLKGSDRLQSVLSSLLNSTIGRYMGWMLRGSDVIICASNAQKKILLEKDPNLEKKITVIYNPLPDLKLLLIRDRGFAYFGGASSLKGFNVLINALPNVPYEKFRLKAVGFRGNIDVSVSDKRVDFTGWISSDEQTKIYSNIHAVVVPSIVPEPAPYVIYEAILRGRLVIGSRIGGIPELLSGYKGCLLVKPGDSLDLAEKIGIMQNIDLDEAQDLAYFNRNRLCSMDQNRAMVNSFEHIFKKLYNDPRI